MSLIGALQSGRSALAATQAQIQTTANNIANAGTEGYTRQVARTVAAGDQQLRPGVFLGTGVDLISVQRQIDEALESRIRASVSDDESAKLTEQWMGRIESVFNELTDQDLSTQMSQFFNAWSDLANKPQDPGLRQVVLQAGQSLSNWMQATREQLSRMKQDVDSRLTALAGQANTLAGKIAQLNKDIVAAEGGGGGQANGLRDQRDAVLRELSTLADIRTQEHPSGIVDVYVGSEPLVVGDRSRGVALKQDVVDGEVQSAVVFASTNGKMKLDGKGQLGALSNVRSTVTNVVDQLDTVAGTMIFELNKLHSAGQGLEGFASVSANNIVADPTAALNSADADLRQPPVNGSFVVHVKDKTSGLVTSTLVSVDLDGLNGNDTTLDSLRLDLDGIDGVTASVSGGRLRIDADSAAVELSFSQDSSGVLASLGVNSFFKGSDARDIAVDQRLFERPSLISAARNGQPGDNQTARAIADLQNSAIASLGGQSLKTKYEAMINNVASTASGAKNTAASASAVRETLLTQREMLSGVSMDEEAINLMKYQRAYQGAARVVAAVDELMQTMLSLV